MRNKKFKFCSVFLCIFPMIIVLTSCDVCKKNATKEDYKEFAYVELKNNNDASLEIKNQIDFTHKQLERKKLGKQYSSNFVERIIVLSGITAKIESVGSLGNSYEITEVVIQKWEEWYSVNYKYLSYEWINNKKVIVINYPDGRKIISPN